MDSKTEMILIVKYGGIAPTTESTIDSGDWPWSKQREQPESD